MIERAISISTPIMVYDPVILPAGAGGRVLRVRVTAPAEPADRLAVILFSHGMSLGRAYYPALVDWWARAGFVVLAPDHADALLDGFAPPDPLPGALWRSRILDLQRLAGGLAEIEQAVPALAGRLDPGRLLAAGHSYGGHSVAALMGAGAWDESIARFEHFDMPNIRGALLLAPPGMGGDGLTPAFRTYSGFLTSDWSQLRGPMLVMVGTEDDSREMTTLGAGWHEDIYRLSTAPEMGLIAISGAKHYLGGIVDPRRTGVEDADPARLAAVRNASLAFFRAVLDGRHVSPDLFEPLGTPGSVDCR